MFFSLRQILLSVLLSVSFEGVSAFGVFQYSQADFCHADKHLKLDAWGTKDFERIWMHPDSSGGRDGVMGGAEQEKTAVNVNPALCADIVDKVHRSLPMPM